MSFYDEVLIRCDISEVPNEGIVFSLRTRMRPSQESYDKLIEKIRERFKKEGINLR